MRRFFIGTSAALIVALLGATSAMAWSTSFTPRGGVQVGHAYSCTGIDAFQPNGPNGAPAIHASCQGLGSIVVMPLATMVCANQHNGAKHQADEIAETAYLNTFIGGLHFSATAGFSFPGGFYATSTSSSPAIGCGPGLPTP